MRLFKCGSGHVLARPPACLLVCLPVDLEGDEFEEDAANLAAWQEAFDQHHYWALPLGPVLAVGLSTVRFRSNAHRWAGQGGNGWLAGRHGC